MKILIVSHDSGGAEILSSWIKTRKNDVFKYILKGPSINIFRKKIKNVKVQKTNLINNLILTNDLIITGTSEKSKIEKIITQKSILLNKKVITFVDYWYNFKNRFTLNNKTIFPNEVWVFDKMAYQIALKYETKTKILLKKNYYISNLLSKKNKKLVSLNKNNIIYLCQPYLEYITHNKEEPKSINDSHGLEFFFKKIIKYKLDNYSIMIRLHPTQKKSTYKKLILKYKDRLNIKISNNTLDHDLSWGSLAVGMHTNALFVALSFKLKTYHCIPPGAKKCVLPFQNIKNFNFKKNINYKS